ncbi:hypothetical protein HYX58_03620 [Candidatus Dependentiae bacterium]|nr:hypothetical protein [Candidatus Dependentiae bacterium]
MFFNKKMSLIAVFCFFGNQLLTAQKAPQIIRMEQELERREKQRKDFICSKRGSTQSTDMVFLGGLFGILAGTYYHDLIYMGCATAAAIGAVGIQEYQVNKDDKRCIQENVAYFQKELGNLEKFCEENEVTLSYINASGEDKELIRNNMNKVKADWRKQLENCKKK